ncbi:hypothetical protein F4604DRAFT_1686356 [Suillus subluteus]|nr:hypothetical protein F4604DRAFT_1686353 [Suillus subluteus]KAG1853356.1 hypothetical protein F4604DRAFT_1686356 [Suillus subluteus]
MYKVGKKHPVSSPASPMTPNHSKKEESDVSPSHSNSPNSDTSEYIYQMRDKVDVLRQKNRDLREQNKRLRGKNRSLEALVHRVKRELAELELDLEGHRERIQDLEKEVQHQKDIEPLAAQVAELQKEIQGHEESARLKRQATEQIMSLALTHVRVIFSPYRTGIEISEAHTTIPYLNFDTKLEIHQPYALSILLKPFNIYKMFLDRATPGQWGPQVHILKDEIARRGSQYPCILYGGHAYRKNERTN